MEFIKTKGNGPERIEVDMLDPVFPPGDSRTAVAPITISPSGLSCQGELYLGPSPGTKVVTSGLRAFTSTGAAQSISFPVTMPTTGGVAYRVYLDIYAAGYLIGSYIATEDVVIPSVTVGPITW